MRVAVITSKEYGLASMCLEALCHTENIEVCGVIWSTETGCDRWKARKRQIKKVLKIGLLGALNGIRMRKWYVNVLAPSIRVACEKLQVPLILVDRVNGELMKATLKEMRPDLAISLGNGYISPSVFNLPIFGMINVHTEILPQFQGAQSIIWPIYEGLKETGFTIHQIDASIDTGAILYQKRLAIQFEESLSQTVRVNLVRVCQEVPAALAYTVAHYHELRESQVIQTQSKRYTTPSIWAFFRMVCQHRKLRRQAGGKDGSK